MLGRLFEGQRLPAHGARDRRFAEHVEALGLHDAVLGAFDELGVGLARLDAAVGDERWHEDVVAFRHPAQELVAQLEVRLCGTARIEVQVEDQQRAQRE